MNRMWFLAVVMMFAQGQLYGKEGSPVVQAQDTHTFWEYCAKPVRIVSIAFKAQEDPAFMETLEQEARRGVDLIVLTETWADKRLFTPDEPFFKPLAELAKQYHTYIVSPVYRLKEAQIFNTAIVYNRQGKIIGMYDKVQPVLSDPPGRGGEGWQVQSKHMTVLPGSEAPVFDTDFGRIGLAICFDAQFPEVWQRLANNGAELVLFSSAYSAGRSLGAYATLHHYYVVSATWRKECQVYDITGDQLLDERKGISRMVLDMGRIMCHNNDSYNYTPPFNWPQRFGKINRLLKENPGVIMDKRQDREDWHVLKVTQPGIDLRSLFKKYDIQDLRTYLNKQRAQANQLRGFKFNRVGPKTE